MSQFKLFGGVGGNGIGAVEVQGALFGDTAPVPGSLPQFVRMKYRGAIVRASVARGAGGVAVVSVPEGDGFVVFHVPADLLIKGDRRGVLAQVGDGFVLLVGRRRS